MEAEPVRRRLPLKSAALLLLSVACIGAASVKLSRADAGVEVSRARIGATPVSVFRASDMARQQALPVVVISHGFAGSQQLMRPFAVSLAKNGYLAVTFDYFGHGRNPEALRGDVTKVEGATRMLLEQTREVVDYALALPAAGDGLALLGHSMASDIIVRYAQSDARVKTTIAVSMFSPAVTPTEPPNLLMIVGSLEGFLREEALRVLAMSADDPVPGETYGQFEDGSARRAAIAAGVEHVGVLYSPDSMREAVNWLDQVFSREGSGYADNRGGAVALLILGLCLLAWPLAGWLPVVSRPRKGASLGWRRLLPVAIVPAIATPLLLWQFPADFLSVLVGGYLGVHFAVYGLLTGACLWWVTRSGKTESDAGTNRLNLGIASVASTAYVAGVFAAVLDTYVTSFAITSARLPLVFVMLAGTLAYFLADEWVTRGENPARGGHLMTRFCFLVSLGIAVALSFEDLFFLLIIAAVIVLYFLIYGFFSTWIYRRTGHPAVGAIANAVAFAWALAVVFPMLSG